MVLELSSLRLESPGSYLRKPTDRSALLTDRNGVWCTQYSQYTNKSPTIGRTTLILSSNCRRLKGFLSRGKAVQTVCVKRHNNGLFSHNQS